MSITAPQASEVTRDVYRAVVTREGNDWLAEIPGLPGAHAFAHTLAALRSELADAIILSAELADDAHPDVRLSIAPDTHDPVALKAAVALELADRRASYEAVARELATQTAAKARELGAAGWSVRDIAGALGISPGRVSQLLR